MKATWRSAMVAVAATVGLSAGTGCAAKDGGDDGPSLKPGQGLVVAGAEVPLGATRATVEAALGAGVALRDLGPLGVRFEASDLHLAGRLSSLDASGVVTALDAFEGFAGCTPEGVCLGADEATVEAAYGAAEVAPFIGSWVYPSRGLALTWGDGVVVGVHVMPTDP